jgi:hypothetical protein
MAAQSASALRIIVTVGHDAARRQNEKERMMMRIAAVAIATLALLATPTLAASKRDAPVNKATEIHGAPGNTPGFGGSSASPNGNGKNGGNGIHAIAGGAPGQGGVNEPDDRPAGNMHGGLAGATGYSK